MQHDDLVYLGHMLDRAKRAAVWLQGVSRAEFDDNEQLRVAVRHLIQTIGEAARHVSEDMRARHPEIPWHSMVGMRNRIVHDYAFVDDDTVWSTAVTELPELVGLLEPLVPARFRLPIP